MQAARVPDSLIEMMEQRDEEGVQTLAPPDPKPGDQVLALLLEINRLHGTALVVGTHRPERATRLGRRVELRDGYLEDPAALA